MGIIKDKKAYLAFLLPGLLFYLFSVFYPIVESMRLSFMKWSGIGAMKFVGFSNYAKLMKDSTFFTALWNNLVYLIVVVAMQLLIGMLFAVLLTYMKRGAVLVKTVYYVPCIITTVAVSQLFRSMYAVEPVGLLNQLLNSIGLGYWVQPWLTNVNTALVAVSIPEGWRFTGFYMVIYYSALISLDPQVLEAANIDGANELQTLLHVKLPLIRPVILLSLTMCLTGALRGFDIPYLLTNGGPGNITELMSTYMYKKAFLSTQFGYGSAIAVFIILESIVVVALLRGLYAVDRDAIRERRRAKCRS